MAYCLTTPLPNLIVADALAQKVHGGRAVATAVAGVAGEEASAVLAVVPPAAAARAGGGNIGILC